jgi:hypothetical protein
MVSKSFGLIVSASYMRRLAGLARKEQKMAERTITPWVVGPAGSTAIIEIPASSEWQTLSSADNAHIDLDDSSTQFVGEDVILLVALASGGSTSPGIKILTSTKSPYTGSGQANETYDITLDASISTVGSTGAVLKGCIAVVGPFESARFKDTDGYLNFARSTSDTATPDYKVGAIVIRRRVANG